MVRVRVGFPVLILPLLMAHSVIAQDTRGFPLSMAGQGKRVACSQALVQSRANHCEQFLHRCLASVPYRRTWLPHALAFSCGARNPQSARFRSGEKQTGP